MPARCCSSVNEPLKSKLKSLPSEDAHGKLHPIRALVGLEVDDGSARHRRHGHVVILETKPL
jgi:hypothetical protein